MMTCVSISRSSHVAFEISYHWTETIHDRSADESRRELREGLDGSYPGDGGRGVARQIVFEVVCFVNTGGGNNCQLL